MPIKNGVRDYIPETSARTYLPEKIRMPSAMKPAASHVNVSTLSMVELNSALLPGLISSITPMNSPIKIPAMKIVSTLASRILLASAAIDIFIHYKGKQTPILGVNLKPTLSGIRMSN